MLHDQICEEIAAFVPENPQICKVSGADICTQFFPSNPKLNRKLEPSSMADISKQNPDWDDPSQVDQVSDLVTTRLQDSQ